MSSFVRRPPTVSIDGDAIRGIREHKGLTQLYVAEVVGVSVDTVSRWENRRTPAVKRENAEALATALEVELDAILLREEEAAEERRDERRGRPRAVLLGLVFGIAALGIGLYWWYAAQPPILLEASRRLPPYTPPGTAIPVIVTVKVTSGQVSRVILREELPEGWQMVAARPVPDQGPTPDRVVKWILPVEGDEVRIAYLARAPLEAPESSAYRFAGEVVSSDRRAGSFTVRGQSRIDLEYVHWADEDADFHIGDAEVLDALERLEATGDLGPDPEDLRTLWGESEYEWDRDLKEFHSARR